jgi:hypothetical protein
VKAPLGANVSLYYDSAIPVSEGDLIVTLTKRTYRVTAVRIQERGIHIGRQHIRANVVDHDEAMEQLEDETVHHLHWYRR